MEQPKYKPGDHVKTRNDEGEWDEAWIVEVIPTYKYTIRKRPDKFYKGTPIVGVYVSGKDIRRFTNDTYKIKCKMEDCDICANPCEQYIESLR